jgi:hypothetical protein
MRLMKWVGIAAAILLIVACFMPWVIIPSKNITVSGVSTDGTSFGKPAYLHFILALSFVFLSLIKRIWAKRVNLILVALNLAWAIRNYFMVSTCRAGECPEKQLAIFLIVIASVIMLIAALFPDIKLAGQDDEKK